MGKLKRKIGMVVMLAMALSSLAVGFAGAAENKLQGFGIDTVAGHSALLTTNAVGVGEQVEFHLVKPNGAALYFVAETDLSGVAQVDVDGYHTREAGVYKVGARRLEGGGDEKMIYSNFEVYPGKVSDNYSVVKADEMSVVASGMEKVRVVVELKDEYGNPLEGRLVNLISSRSEDKVVRIDGLTGTNVNGVAQFAVSSNRVGVSSYTAIDTATGLVLSERAKVVYTEVLARGGGIDSALTTASFIPVANAQEPLVGAVSGFVIEELPLTLVVNQTATFAVRAVDNQGQTVTNYQGTIKINTTDEEAVITEEYDFTPEDLGDHRFELGARFLTEGTHTVQVIDMEDPTLTGDIQVIVTKEQDLTGKEVVITSPQEGVHTEDTILIEGTAPSLEDVDVYDGSVKLGTVGSTVDGDWEFTAKNLADGEHLFRGEAFDGELKSEVVRVTIGGGGIMLVSVRVDPEDPFLPETPFKLIVETNPGLVSVRAVLDRNPYTLIESLDTPGTYTADMVAPKESGEYPIDLMLEDELGEKKEEKGAYTLVVEEEEAKKVFGVRAKAGNGRVTLSWAPVEGAAAYRVNYGVEPGEYPEEVVTDGSVARQEVDGLINGRKYFFTVTGLDEEGGDYTEESEEVSATPFDNRVMDLVVEAGDGMVELGWKEFKGAGKYLVRYGLEPGSYTEEEMTEGAETEMVIENLINNQKYYFTVQALGEAEEEISDPSEERDGIPMSGCAPREVRGLVAEDSDHDGVLKLAWDEEEGVEEYAVYIGKERNDLDFVGKVKEGYWEGELEDGKYYVAVKTVCPDMHEAPIDFERVVEVEVGMELVLVIAAGFLLLVGAWKFRLLPRKAGVKRTRGAIAEVLGEDK